MHRVGMRVAGAGLMLALLSVQAWALETVTVQLRWHHQFQFAGYYAAVEKGFYRAEGLDVRLVAGTPERQAVSEVLAGRAEYGEGNSEVLFHRLNGAPLVALAAIFQHSPSVLLARADSGITSAHDLIGKRVMLMGGAGDADFLSMLLSEGVDLRQVDIIPSSFDISDLVAGRVDAFNSYLTNEPYYLQQRGVPYSVVDPRSYRIDFYSDIFFTTERELEEHPQRVAAMRRATLKGWAYAMEHPEEIIQLLLDKYQVGKTPEHLAFEAKTMERLILPGLIEIGHMNPGRWQHMADTLVSAGIVDGPVSLEGFLYDPQTAAPQADLTRLYPILGLALAVVSVLFAVALYIYRINCKLRQSIRRLQVLSTAVEQSPTSIVVTDPDLVIRYVNPLFLEETGYSEAEILGRTPGVLGSGKTPDSVYRTLWQRLHSGQSWHGEFLNRKKSGELFWEEAHIAPVLDPRGETTHYVAVKLNITERKARELALRESEEQYRRLYELTSDAVMLLDKDGYLDCNAAAARLFGCGSREALRLLHPGTLSPPQQPDGADSLALSGERIDEALEVGHVRFEWVHRRVDSGVTFPADVQLSSFSIKGKTVFQAVVRDISRLKLAEEQARKEAQHDPLTGLPNRRLLDKRVREALARSTQTGQRGAILFIDLDNFKPLNDNWGHEVGDQLLVTVARRLRSCVREQDMVARVGGDEFVVLLEQLGPERPEALRQARHVASKLCRRVAEPYQLRRTSSGQAELELEVEHQCTASVGAALLDSESISVDSLMRDADEAMYRAKESGRNRVCFAGSLEAQRAPA